MGARAALTLYRAAQKTARYIYMLHHGVCSAFCRVGCASRGQRGSRLRFCLHPRKIDAAFGGLDVRLPLDKEAWQRSAHEWSSPTDGEATLDLHGLQLKRCNLRHAIIAYAGVLCTNAMALRHRAHDDAEYRVAAVQQLMPNLLQVRLHGCTCRTWQKEKSHAACNLMCLHYSQRQLRSVWMASSAAPKQRNFQERGVEAVHTGELCGQCCMRASHNAGSPRSGQHWISITP